MFWKKKKTKEVVLIDSSGRNTLVPVIQGDGILLAKWYKHNDEYAILHEDGTCSGYTCLGGFKVVSWTKFKGFEE